jgi:hypothetical protein
MAFPEGVMLIRLGQWTCGFACASLVLAVAAASRSGTSEESSVQLVLKYGGTIERDEEVLGKPVVAVSLNRTKFGNADLKGLAGFPVLQSLDLFSSKVTGEGLTELGRFRQLRHLELSQNQVTDEAIRSLHKVGLLHALRMATTDPDDVPRPKGPDDVTRLNLANTCITDASLKYLRPLKNLRSLSLSGCRDVGDAGLKDLASLPNLKALVVNYTAITDMGLKNLASVKTLERVTLDRTKVTEAGIQHLRKALPKCRIVR